VPMLASDNEPMAESPISRCEPDVVFATIAGQSAPRFYPMYSDPGIDRRRRSVASLIIQRAGLCECKGSEMVPNEACKCATVGLPEANLVANGSHARAGVLSCGNSAFGLPPLRLLRDQGGKVTPNSERERTTVLPFHLFPA